MYPLGQEPDKFAFDPGLMEGVRYMDYISYLAFADICKSSINDDTNHLFLLLLLLLFISNRSSKYSPMMVARSAWHSGLVFWT